MPGEFDLIAKYFTRPTPSAVLGVGDDCALFAPAPGMQLAISTDMLIAGRHFSPSDGPGTIGHKAMAVNLSDLAAMGATPRYALLSIALPEADEKFLQGFAGGFFGLAQKYGVEVIGGDTTRSGLLTLNVTVIGEVPPNQALRRDAAQAGDDIWVSGTLGDAALAVAARNKKISLTKQLLKKALQRLDKPTPRVVLGGALRGIARSAIDISDGLLADLGHICERSHVAAVIEFEALPRSSLMRSVAAARVEARVVQGALLAGGDDYELCFTAPSSRRAAVLGAGARTRTPVTRIGRILHAPAGATAVAVVDGGGMPLAITQRGFDHFG